MPIKSFEGKTFLAFVDISGFKRYMREDSSGKKAWRVLDRFYNAGFDILRNQDGIDGIFISDSGIIFSRNCSERESQICLGSLLEVVKELNIKMLKEDVMLKTSVAFGHFKYERRIEFTGIRKDSVFGNAYLRAYLDSEKDEPKMEPGECRIVIESLPDSLKRYFDEERNEEDAVLRMVRRKSDGGSHLYYYWMLDDPSQIGSFNEEFSEILDCKFKGILELLKRSVHHARG